ncbi:MAG TPA: hypothetical protein DCR44_03035 [Acholeplasmatales bacterium]|nr:hypothetical protein [Acholeplasmatales bacterium]
MKRNEFIVILTKRLNEQNVGDIDEIIAEYEAHFAYKLADGYTEEEIAIKLGDPDELACQFVAVERPKKHDIGRGLLVTGLVFADFFTGLFFILLAAWTMVIIGFAFASAAIGVAYLIELNPYGILPPMPYWVGAVFAASLLALAVLSLAGSLYFGLYVKQLLKAYGRFHHNRLAVSAGKPVLPSLRAYPKLKPRENRLFRKVVLGSLTIFALCFVLGYIVASITAGTPGFWHAWNWFV